MGSSKRNLLTSILLLVVMGVFAVLTIFIVVDAINKKYYNDIKVEYEVQEEEDLNNVILTFARNEGSAYSTETVKAVRNPEDKTKFRIDGTVPTIEDGVVTNLDDLTSSDGREFFFFSTNSSFIDPQEDPENPDFIFSKTDSRYYVSTENNPIWYDVPKSSENLTLYSVFLTPNVHNSDFANAPLLNVDPNVIISHDVVDIPYNAFSDLMVYQQSQGQTGAAKIESVVIPNSTKSINSEFDVNMGGAFALCTTLTNIVIPSSVEYIGGEAFMLCTGLDTVEYENGHYLPTESNKHAVLIDTNIKAEDVTIHETCISIQGNTFSKYFFIMLGLITPGAGESEEDYININLREVTIPKNVKNIGMGAFAMCSGLTNVEFGENSDLTSIGAISFTNCSSLKTINLEGAKLEEIGMSTLSITAIEEITLPSTLKTIGEGAFGYCGSLKTVNFENNSQLTSIGERAFEGCSSLTSIIIPESVTSIGDSAFRSCSSLTSITIPESVTSIGVNAFSRCSSLETINFEGEPKLTSIRQYAFFDCSSLTSITIPSNVTSIGERAFSGCSSLTSITIPESVMSIGDNAFYECSSLESIDFGEGSQLTSIGERAFSYCSNLTSITIPEGVTSIGNYAFAGCSSLTSITVPDSVTSIGKYYVFSDCSSLESITFEDMKNLTGITIGNIFDGCDNINQLTIQSGEVKDLGFSVLSNLTTVILGDGVTSIGDNAFEDCRSLETVNLGENSILTSIGERAFSYCSSLSSITIPDSVTSIGSGAFSGCSSLPSITIPDGITSIEGSVFMYCNSLTSITIPDSVTSIGSGAFAYCSSLASITIPSSVTSIGSSAFWNCSSLTSITIPDSVTSIGYSVFSSCSSLTSIIIPESVTSIGKRAFEHCSSLISITIPDSVTSIGGWAFNNCSSLTSITIPDSVTSIGERAFISCSSLTSIIIPKSVTSIEDYAFEDCSTLTIYCEASSQPSGWSSSWNGSNRPEYWAGEWKMVDGVPVPIESGVEGVGYRDVGEDFGIGFDGLGFREEIYFNDKRERKVV